MTQVETLALVVEDDHDLAEMYRMTLKQAGFSAHVRRNGYEALQYLAEQVPALVLLDLNLPEVSGTQVLNHIRADEALQGIKVMIVTANPEMADAIRPKADLVLLKPTSLTQIRDLSRRLVNL